MNLRKASRIALAAACLLPFLKATAESKILAEDQLFVSQESLEKWNDLRFGMFIHWGPWSQREVGYIWKMVNEEDQETGSKSFDLWETFNPTKFDPEKWAKTAKDAGMKYVVFVVKHHDGVNNYDTQTTDYKVTNPIVPYSKNKNADLTKAIVDAFRAEGIAIGLYYSHIDWHHPDGKFFSRDGWEYDESKIDSDPEAWRRFVEFEKEQVRELLTNYGKIDIIWYDIHWPTGGTSNKVTEHPEVRKGVLELLSLMKELQPDIVFNDRGTDKFGGFYTPEQQVPATGLPGYWESNITITNERGFWYKGDKVTAKSPEMLTRMLIEIAAKGGNFLMNVGPRPDGEFSKSEYNALSGIGDWMKLNSESIYGTDRSLFIDLPWGWSTTSSEKLYLHVFDWPQNGNLDIPGLRSDIQRAYLLEDDKQKALTVSEIDDGKRIAVGKTAPNKIASVVVLEIEGKPDIFNTTRQIENQPIVLSTAVAEIESKTANYNFGTATRVGNFIQDIASDGDTMTWGFQLKTPGKYKISVKYATQNPQAGSHFSIGINDLVSFNGIIRGTADWEGDLLEVKRQNHDEGERHNNQWTFKEHDMGTFEFSEAGTYKLKLTANEIHKDYLAFVKSISIRPAN